MTTICCWNCCQVEFLDKIHPEMPFPWRCFYQRKHKKTRKQPQKLPDHKSDHERPWLTKALKCCWMLTSALFLIFPRLRQLLASSGLFWTFWPNFCCFRPFYATSNLFWPFWPILVSPPPTCFRQLGPLLAYFLKKIVILGHCWPCFFCRYELPFGQFGQSWTVPAPPAADIFWRGRS